MIRKPCCVCGVKPPQSRALRCSDCLQKPVVFVVCKTCNRVKTRNLTGVCKKCTEPKPRCATCHSVRPPRDFKVCSRCRRKAHHAHSERVKNKVCVRCGAEVTDKKHCEPCLQRVKDNQLKLSEAREQAGLCPRCGGQRNEAFKYCQPCRTRFAEAKHALIADKKCVQCRDPLSKNDIARKRTSCLKCRKRLRGYRAVKVKRLLIAGKCQNHPKRKATLVNKYACTECVQLLKDRSKARREKNKKERRCLSCTTKLKPSENIYCATHRAARREQGRRYWKLKQA